MSLSKLLALLVCASFALGAVSRAAEMDVKATKTPEEIAKEKKRRATLAAAGIDPDRKPAAPPAAPAAPAKPGAAPAVASATGLQSYTFNVTGMMCNNCEQSVTTSFKKSEGVSNVAAVTAAGTAVVTYDPAKTSIEKLLEEFKVNKMARFTAMKAGEKPAYVYSGKDETLMGGMSIKGKDAAADVVARINAHREGEPAERYINLLATGELATKIEEIRKSGVRRVKIVGVVSDAGVKVNSIEPQ